MMTPHETNKEILEAVQKISIAVAVIDERIKNHLEDTLSLKQEVSKIEEKLDAVSHQTNRHSFFFKSGAWIISIAASCIGVKVSLGL